MREIYEFRIPEANACMHLPDSTGKRSKTGIARVIEAPSIDPLFETIGVIDKEFQKTGRSFFTGWDVRRKYTDAEIQKAAALRLMVRTVFEPCGEECGTEYDETTACKFCGSGASQLSPLMLDSRRIPKHADISQTIAGEFVVTTRFVESLGADNSNTAMIAPIHLIDKKGVTSGTHYQLRFAAGTVGIDKLTRFGNDPFSPLGAGRCERGDLLGLNILSELYIKQRGSQWQGIASTVEFIGCRRGLLRPSPALILSKEAWQTMRANKIRGVDVEVVHVV
ncbi:MAG: hypothetical protein ING66_05020 [Rhodocyclaceae bacterium]|nr:hypothetical protein [Rhodocyclaceae bacterium]MCA3084492.1 hypothetical protein [Rhodocyclaceae bacterium]